MTSIPSAINARFGKLWALGHESFSPSIRRIFSVKGKGATNFLQGLVTSDLHQIPLAPREEKVHPNTAQSEERGHDLNEEVLTAPITTELMRSTCFLDQRGRNLTDALLWKIPKNNGPNGENETREEEYLIEVPANTAETLFEHLKKYTMKRSKVVIDEKTNNVSSHVIYGTLNTSGTPPGFLSVSIFYIFLSE